MTTRAYAVGLPAVVTITAEGFVTVAVDLSELGESIGEDTAPIVDPIGAGYADEVIRGDAATLSGWARTHAVSGEGYAEPMLVEGTPEHAAAYGEPDET